MSRNDPASVAAGKACEICWRPFGGGGCTQQTLDGISRLLCSSCATLFFPVAMGKMPDLPPGYGNANLMHLDTSELKAAIERDEITKELRDGG